MPDIVGNLRLDQPGAMSVSAAPSTRWPASISQRATQSGTVIPTTNMAGQRRWADFLSALARRRRLNRREFRLFERRRRIRDQSRQLADHSWRQHRRRLGGRWNFDGPGLPVTAHTQIHLTNAWSVNAGYEHFWNPRWRTSLYGGYTRVWYDAEITNDINSHLPGAAGTVPCGVPVAGSVWPPINVNAGANSNSCSPNFSFYQVGSRTQWNVTRDFYMGVDVTYTHLNTAYQGANNSGTPVRAHLASKLHSPPSTIKVLSPGSSGRR